MKSISSFGNPYIRYNESSDNVEVYFQNQWLAWKSASMKQTLQLIPMAGGSLTSNNIYGGSESGFALANVINDNNSSHYLSSFTSSSSLVTLTYTFPEDVIITDIYLSAYLANSTTVGYIELKIGDAFSKITDFTIYTTSRIFQKNISSTQCTAIRVNINGSNYYDGNNWTTLTRIQVYGRKLITE